MSDFLSSLEPGPEGLLTPASRRAFALNEGYRALATGGEIGPRNYAVWLASRAAGFVQAEDYPIVVCDCPHGAAVEEARSRGAPSAWCQECDHLVRLSFTARAIHCERR